MEMHTIVANFDGYLHCLRRLSDNSCDFWANTFELSSSVEESLGSHLSGHSISITESFMVGYSEVTKVLEKHLFLNLASINADQKKLIEWDFIEYIEVACRTHDPESSPISNSQALLFNAKSEFHGQYVYLVIPVKNQAIIVGLAIRA